MVIALLYHSASLLLRDIFRNFQTGLVLVGWTVSER